MCFNEDKSVAFGGFYISDWKDQIVISDSFGGKLKGRKEK